MRFLKKLWLAAFLLFPLPLFAANINVFTYGDYTTNPLQNSITVLASQAASIVNPAATGTQSVYWYDYTHFPSGPSNQDTSLELVGITAKGATIISGGVTYITLTVNRGNPPTHHFTRYQNALSVNPSFITGTPTNTATNTPTNTATNTATATPTNTKTKTPTPTVTNTFTLTPTPTCNTASTPECANQFTLTPTDTPTDTTTNTPTDTPTNTTTNTTTATPTNTKTKTPTATPTNTQTPTPTYMNTVTPLPTVSFYAVDIVGRSLESDSGAGVIAAQGSNLLCTYDHTAGAIEPGDFVAFTGLSTTAANAIWPVVYSSGDTIVAKTDVSSITVGAGATIVFMFDGNRCQNLGLISGLGSSAGAGSYQFNFVNTQPDYFYIGNSGYFIDSTSEGVVDISSTTATYAILKCRLQATSSDGTLTTPATYFSFHFHYLK